MSDEIDRNRRRLLALGVWAGAGGALAGRARAAAVSPATVAAAAPVGGAAPLAELAYGQVQFRGGPVARQARENHRWVLEMSEDSLLLPFRMRAGQSAPGSDLGGWYGTYAFAPGAQFGQWMSALSRHYAITGDAATRAKVGRLVAGYTATVDAQGRFYQSNRFPSYTYDKLAGGLVDAQQLSRIDLAPAALARATQAALPYLPPKAIPRNEHAHPPQDFTEHAWDESYTIPENQFLAWRASGDARHLELARRFLYDEFFGALARGENALPGKHAYSHVNALSSAAQAYLSLGQPMYLDAARNGFDMIVAQSFATGGWGPDEHFVVPGSGALAASLQKEQKSFETPCGSYAHLKLTRYLLRFSGDSRYGDSMERVLYNTVLGALPVQPDGHAFYYSDYTRRAHKGFHPDRWPCCSGSLPMVTADYAISACFSDADGLYVNLYAPAEISWRQNGNPARLAIATEYPYAPRIALTLELERPQEFALRLRIPAWAEGARVLINGAGAPQRVEPGRFITLRREWRPADRIELDLPLDQRLESIDSTRPDVVALLAGPLVLMRMVEGAEAAPLPRAALLAARRAPGAGREWHAGTGAGAARLRSFMDIGSESYSVYQDVVPS